MAMLYRFEFTVFRSRPGAFPLDMLRYDHCCPATEEDSGKIAATFSEYLDPESLSEKIEVRLKAYFDNSYSPHVDRWRSFGWDVKPVIDKRKL